MYSDMTEYGSSSRDCHPRESTLHDCAAVLVAETGRGQKEHKRCSHSHSAIPTAAYFTLRIRIKYFVHERFELPFLFFA